MATAFLLLAGLLLPCWGGLVQDKKKTGDKCSHHSECYTDCCLMDLQAGGAFCAPKARTTMACLPQLALFKSRDCILFIYEVSAPSLVPTHNQGSHQHHLPMPPGLELHIQGPDVSPSVPYVLEEDTDWSPLPWGQRPWAHPACSKSGSC
uniref:Colipase like 2 n=1 Tax=Microcebus murinus TaxID=30608 RepID=A0A8C5YAM8_MICMU